MTVKDEQIIINIDGELIVAVGDVEHIVVRSTNSEYTKQVKRFMKTPTPVNLLQNINETVMTGKDTYTQIAASMVAVSPGRATIEAAPAEVTNLLNTYNNESFEGLVF